jgi:hypothetical protein
LTTGHLVMQKLSILPTAVRVFGALIVLASAAAAQPAPPAPARNEPFSITDNSFLVEEAFNQERGVFQNIFGATRAGGHWASSFTQEWPAPSQQHQLSYTVSWLDAGLGAGFGDTLINYRYQALTEENGRPAFSPRASLILPSGRASRGRGFGSVGLQLNMPFSKQTGDWYWHWNGGLTWLPRARVDLPRSDGTISSRRANLASPFVAGSGIFRVRQMLNLMLESYVVFEESIGEDGVKRDTAVTLSPGVRGGFNVGDKQIVLGAALPITWSDGRDAGLFVYLSYELPFRR